MIGSNEPAPSSTTHTPGSGFAIGDDLAPGDLLERAAARPDDSDEADAVTSSDGESAAAATPNPADPDAPDPAVANRTVSVGFDAADVADDVADATDDAASTLDVAAASEDSAAVGVAPASSYDAAGLVDDGSVAGHAADAAGDGAAAMVAGDAAEETSVVGDAVDVAGDGGAVSAGDGAASGDSGGAGDGEAGKEKSGFHLRLSNFQGPFDLLLTLISSRKLDVTEVALHQVTDEFIAYTKALTAALSDNAATQALRADKILDQTTEFLVVAATLLDLKAARLLPSGEVTDADDLELLEARDLLFARLLQYRAFKQVAELLGELEAVALRRYPRAVGLEERFADLLPEVTLGVDAHELAAIAAAAFRPRPVPKVGLDHLHAHAISVADQAALVLERLKLRGRGGWTTFGELVDDCDVPIEIVARFLALLELYRGKTIEFDQPDPLGQLSISWIGEEVQGEPTEAVTIEEDYG